MLFELQQNQFKAFVQSVRSKSSTSSSTQTHDANLHAAVVSNYFLLYAKYYFSGHNVVYNPVVVSTLLPHSQPSRKIRQGSIHLIDESVMNTVYSDQNLS